MHLDGGRGGGAGHPRWCGRGSSRRSAAAGVLLAAALLGAAPAHAQEASKAEQARTLYNDGAAAYEQERWAQAARSFARADAAAPNAVALALAIESATLAGDAVFAMSLVDRARTRPHEAKLDEAVQLAEKKLAGKTGRIRVKCPSLCDVVVDGEAFPSGEAARVLAGERAVRIRVARQPNHERRVTVAADGLLEIEYAPPATPASPAASGLSPAWFFVGLGATALAGAGAIASGADTASKHDGFVRAGCAGPVHADCNGAASDGKAAETRTNVLIGVTGALAAASAAVGIGLVRWSSPEGSEVSVSAAGAGFVVRGSL